MTLHNNKKRDEIWYFFDKATVQVGKRKFKVKKRDILKIKKNIAHKIIAGKNKVKVLEICFGKFKEKDEIRLEDKYGRK